MGTNGSFKKGNIPHNYTKIPDNIKNEIIRLYNEEYKSVPEISNIIGIRKNILYNKLKKWGIPRRTIKECKSLGQCDFNNKGHPLTEFKKGFTPWNKGIKTGIVPSTAFGQPNASRKQGIGINNTNYIHGKRVNGAKYPYSPEFMEIRKLVIERDKYCKMCGDEANLVHHIDLNKNNNDINNLILLCNSCHSSIHGKYIERKMIPLIKELL
jgi:hypothetical protein